MIYTYTYLDTASLFHCLRWITFVIWLMMFLLKTRKQLNKSSNYWSRIFNVLQQHSKKDTWPSLSTACSSIPWTFLVTTLQVRIQRHSSTIMLFIAFTLKKGIHELILLQSTQLMCIFMFDCYSINHETEQCIPISLSFSFPIPKNLVPWMGTM